MWIATVRTGLYKSNSRAVNQVSHGVQFVISIQATNSSLHNITSSYMYARRSIRERSVTIGIVLLGNVLVGLVTRDLTFSPQSKRKHGCPVNIRDQVMTRCS